MANNNNGTGAPVAVARINARLLATGKLNGQQVSILGRVESVSFWSGSFHHSRMDAGNVVDIGLFSLNARADHC